MCFFSLCKLPRATFECLSSVGLRNFYHMSHPELPAKGQESCGGAGTSLLRPENPLLVPICLIAKTLGEASLLTVWSFFLLTVKLLCLQSLKALIRRTFPL